MIRIAVCDDQEIVCDTMIRQISDMSRGAWKAEKYISGRKLVEDDKTYDIILLDIDMPDLNGIETAKEIRKKDKRVKIIYITNYGGYAGYAFGVHAFGYLLKPVKEKELKEQILEAVQYLNEEHKKTELELHTIGGLIRIPAEEIFFFEYMDRKLFVYTERGVYIEKEKISNCNEKMAPYGFAMPHKSFVVNLKKIQMIKGNEITLSDGKKIPLSQKKSREFRETLNVYLAERI